MDAIWMKTVLCVDDDAVVRYYVEAMLGKRFKVLTASDGQEGMEILRHSKVDWVIVDFELPDGNGVEFIRKARLVSAIARFVLLSAKNVDQIDWPGLHAMGIEASFRKPLDSDGLFRLFEEGSPVEASRKAGMGVLDRIED